jgi:hypothetical protein
MSFKDLLFAVLMVAIATTLLLGLCLSISGVKL